MPRRTKFIAFFIVVLNGINSVLRGCRRARLPHLRIGNRHAHRIYVGRKAKADRARDDYDEPRKRFHYSRLFDLFFDI